jgi:hypothetical protein
MRVLFRNDCSQKHPQRNISNKLYYKAKPSRKASGYHAYIYVYDMLYAINLTIKLKEFNFLNMDASPTLC